jgi:MFS family permease
LNDFDVNLGLTSQGYNTAVALLTVGYMIGQLPSNMLLTRVRPGIYLSGCALIWSVVSACTAAAHNETSLFVIRFFLGLTEAPLFPGAVFILSAWYTRKELALRITILYSGLVLGQACSGLIAAGVFYGLSGVNGLYGWQWLFILEAASGAAVAILAFFVIPDFPYSKTGAAMWYMTDDMRAVATARMQADRVSEAESDHGVMYGIKLCVRDYKLYVFVCDPKVIDPYV